MDIIVLNDHGYISGGGAQVAISSLKPLSDLGHNVTFIYGVGPIDPSIDQNTINAICLNSIDIGSAPPLKSFIFGLWNFSNQYKLKKILSKYDPTQTIIHLHGWTKSLTSSVIRSAINLDFKVIVTAHDYFTVCPNGGLFNFKKSVNCPIKPLSVKCILTNCDSRSYVVKIWRCFRQAVHNFYGYIPLGLYAIITVSPYSENLLKNIIGNRINYIRINNPIKSIKVRPFDIAKSNNFTFIGRLSFEKGPHIFARAASIARVRSVFVGDGALMHYMRTRFPKSIFLGWCTKGGIYNALKSTRALVFPSLLHETQGLVISEAASMGVPSIVSDDCAGRDSIDDGVTGLLFKHGDIDDLANKILLLADNPGYAERLGQQAYKKYWEKPQDEISHAKNLLKCYYQIL